VSVKRGDAERSEASAYFFENKYRDPSLALRMTPNRNYSHLERAGGEGSLAEVGCSYE
jgi:hypothetical protein